VAFLEGMVDLTVMAAIKLPKNKDLAKNTAFF
jgi:hypothetical protein